MTVCLVISHDQARALHRAVHAAEFELLFGRGPREWGTGIIVMPVRASVAEAVHVRLREPLESGNLTARRAARIGLDRVVENRPINVRYTAMSMTRPDSELVRHLGDAPYAVFDDDGLHGAIDVEEAYGRLEVGARCPPESVAGIAPGLTICAMFPASS